MKTKITILLLLLIVLASKAQNVKEMEEKFNQEMVFQNSRLKTIEKSLKAEQKLLDNSIGDQTKSSQTIKNVEKYIFKRDSIVDLIEKLKNDAIKSIEFKNIIKPVVEKVEETVVKDENNLSKEAKKILEKDAKKEKDDLKGSEGAVSRIKSDASKSTSKSLNNNNPKYLYLNGFNFDFNNSDKSRYVGHLNIYVPAKTSWGYNTGILKLNYQSKDTVVSYQKDNVLKNPLQDIKTDSTYQKQYNRYSTYAKTSSFSAYFQLLYKIARFDDNFKGTTIYFHLHSDLSSTKYEINSRIKTLDTLNVKYKDASDFPENTIDLILPQRNFNINLLNGNFGLGATLDLKFLDNCSLFVQPTIGIAVRHKELTSELEQIKTPLPIVNNNVSTFFLFRSYFEYNVSQLSQLVVGIDVRGKIPNQLVFYSIYAGVNIGIDELGKLLQ